MHEQCTYRRLSPVAWTRGRLRTGKLQVLMSTLLCPLMRETKSTPFDFFKTFDMTEDNDINLKKLFSKNKVCDTQMGHATQLITNFVLRKESSG